MTALPEPTDEQIKAGRRASRKAWLEMADLTETNRRVADALASAPQESDDDALVSRLRAILRDGMHHSPMVAAQAITEAIEAITRLQAKAPEIGEKP